MDSHYLFPYLSHIPYNYYLMYPCYIVYHTLCISKLNASILSRIPAVECSALATLDWSGLCCLQLGHELLHRRGWEVQREVNDTRCVRLKLRGDDNLSDRFMRFISKTKRKNYSFYLFFEEVHLWDPLILIHFVTLSFVVLVGQFVFSVTGPMKSHGVFLPETNSSTSHLPGSYRPPKRKRTHLPTIRVSTQK